MSISFIFWIVSLIILIPTVLLGALSGLRKGAFRAGVKLLALVLSIVISVIITLCLRGVLTDLLSGILMSTLPASMQEQAPLITLIAQIAGAVVTLFAFLLIFTVVRLLMLIPQKIVSRLLPKKLEDINPRQKAEATASTEPEVPAEATPTEDASAAGGEPAAVAETAETSEPVPAEAIVVDAAPVEETPVEAAPVAAQPAPAKNHALRKVLWYGSAALCGALSSLLFLSVLLMPVAGIVTRGGNSVYRVADVMAKEGYGKYSDEISELAQTISTAPLFTVPDILMGKTVFEPMTSISTEYGKISLTDEMETATDILCQALPAAIHVTESGTMNKEDAQRLSGAVDSIAESEFMLSVGTWAAGFAGERLIDSATADTNANGGKQALTQELGEILANMTPEALAEDLHTLAELSEVVAESPILKVLANENTSASPSDLVDRETMRDAFGILYDNDHTQSLLVPLINMGTETVFKSIGAEPIYSDTRIDSLSRDQILEEADRLCDVAENISSFTESMEGESTTLADYEMTAAGKALDSLRDSVLFGSQYDTVVKSVTTAGGSNQNSALIESLGDALVESESAEKLLNSAQSVVIMSRELESSAAKGSENEKLVSSLDVLLNKTSPEDANALSDVAGEHFLDNSNLDGDTKKQMLEDSIKALTAVCAKGSDNVAAEADAVQTFHDLTNAKTENVFEEIGEKKTVDDLLASELAMEMLKNLNAENRDYGIRAKLTEENKQSISAALAESSADAAKKLTVAQFFGVN